jgi:hypothetical protein
VIREGALNSEYTIATGAGRQEKANKEYCQEAFHKSPPLAAKAYDDSTPVEGHRLRIAI